PVEDVGEDLGGLGAGEAVGLVDDEEGDAGGAVGLGGALVGPDGGGVAVAGQDVVDLGGRQPDLHRQAGQRGRVADRLAFGEVGPQEAVLQPVGDLPAVVGGQVEQAVGVEAVAAPDAVEVELEAGVGGGGRDPALHHLGLGPADAVLRGDVLQPVAVAGPGRPGV